MARTRRWTGRPRPPAGGRSSPVRAGRAGRPTGTVPRVRSSTPRQSGSGAQSSCSNQIQRPGSPQRVTPAATAARTAAPKPVSRSRVSTPSSTALGPARGLGQQAAVPSVTRCPPRTRAAAVVSACAARTGPTQPLLPVMADEHGKHRLGTRPNSHGSVGTTGPPRSTSLSARPTGNTGHSPPRCATKCAARSEAVVPPHGPDRRAVRPRVSSACAVPVRTGHPRCRTARRVPARTPGTPDARHSPGRCAWPPG